MIKFFLKDGAIYTVGSIASKGISILLIPIYTRYLSPFEYGIIDLFIIVSGVVNIIFALEITQSIARYYQDISSDIEKTRYTSTAFWFTLASYLIFILIAYLFRDFFSYILLDSPKHKNIFMLASFLIVSNGIYYFTVNQLKWQLQPKDSVFVGILNLIIGGCLILYLLIIEELKVEAFFIGQTIANLCASLIAIYYARDSYAFMFDFSKLKELLKFSVPLVLSALSGFAAIYLDRIFIKKMLGLDELGVYGIAYRFASISSLIFSGFQGALSPLIYKHYREKNTPKDISKIFDMFCCFSMIIIFGSIIFSKEVILTFTTKSFYDAYRLIPILVIAALFLSMYVFAPGLAIAKKTKKLAFVAIMGGISNFIFNIILIPLFGILGAAIATLISSIVLFLLYVIMGNKYYFIPFCFKKNILLSLIIILIGYMINIVIKDINIVCIVTKILLFLIVSVLLMYLTFYKKGFENKCVV